jgi:hypothetical protein
MVQISPYDLPGAVLAAAPGTLRLTPEELELHNSFGESPRT